MSNNKNEKIYNTNILSTKVKIKADQLNKNFKVYLLQKLKKEYEGIFTKFGLVKTDTIELHKISIGKLEQNSFEGNIIYNVLFKAEICNPTIGSIILCTIQNINDFGILCAAKDNNNSIIEVIVPKKSEAIISDIDLSSLNINDSVFVEILGKKPKLNDTKIRCIGKITKTSKLNVNIDDSYSNDIVIETPEDYQDDEVEDEDDKDEEDEEEEEEDEEEEEEEEEEDEDEEEEEEEEEYSETDD